MKLSVNKSQRFAKMRAHTATHLLHAELGKIFPTTKQAWSFVDNDYLRLDFQADRVLTNEEIIQIEKNVNKHIYDAQEVKSDEMHMDDAMKLGAKAFFEDKYGDLVRVVQVDKWISTELCGGTHVENTKDIWVFVIVNQEAIASGIKRITAYTWPRVIEIRHEQFEILSKISGHLWVKSHLQVLDKLEKVLSEYKEANKNVESLQIKVINSVLKEYKSKMDDLFGKKINVSKVNELKGLKFKDIVAHAKKMFSSNTLIFNDEWNFAIISEKKEAKDIAWKLGVKWGWNDELVQWRDSKILE